MATFDQRMTEGTGGVTLAHTGRSEGQQVNRAFEKVAAGQLAQLAPERSWQGVEVEGVEGLAGWQLGSVAQAGDLALPRASASISSTSSTKRSASCCPACSSRPASSAAAVVR